MRRTARAYLLGTVSSFALAGAAVSADMRIPVKAPVVAPPTWAGPYIGINAGVAWHRWSFIDINNNLDLLLGCTGPTCIRNNEFWSGTRTAFTVGGQIGYNLQSGNIVYGVEADLNWVDANDDISFAHPRLPFFGNIRASTRLDWLATFRGRLGVALSPTMIYVTGGPAVAHVKDFYSATLFDQFFPTAAVSSSKTLFGFAVGGGVEHMFTNDWSVKFEAMYVGLPKVEATSSRADNTYRSEFKHSAALVRLGINRKLPFN